MHHVQFVWYIYIVIIINIHIILRVFCEMQFAMVGKHSHNACDFVKKKRYNRKLKKICFLEFFMLV